MLNPQMNSRGAVKHRPRFASVAEPTISPDSLLEGDGFEPSVPGTKEPFFVAEGELRRPNGGSQKGLFLMRYRWFESISLQRRVHCEPDFLPPTTFKLKATTSAARRPFELAFPMGRER